MSLRALGSPKLYKLQPNYYAIYSRPVEKIAIFFAVCELKNFFNRKKQKMRLKNNENFLFNGFCN